MQVKLIFTSYRLKERHCVNGVPSQPSRKMCTLTAVTAMTVCMRGVSGTSTLASTSEVVSKKIRHKTFKLLMKTF